MMPSLSRVWGEVTTSFCQCDAVVPAIVEPATEGGRGRQGRFQSEQGVGELLLHMTATSATFAAPVDEGLVLTGRVVPGR